MNNKKTIEEIRSWYDATTRNNPIIRDIIPFNVQDVQINQDGSFSIEDCSFDESSTKKLFDILNLKDKFIKNHESMGDELYSDVTNKIKRASGDHTIYGALTENADHTYTVTDLYKANPKKKALDDLCNAENMVKNICDSLAASNCSWALKNPTFDNTTATYSLMLNNTSDPIEALKGDMWNQGHYFEFNSTHFSQAPYFERQVCTNGMMKQQLGFKTDISRANWYNDKLSKTISECLTENNTDVAALIETYAAKAKASQINLFDFLRARNMFDSKEGTHADIIEKYFNLAPLYAAYGDDIEKKSTFWKSTAKTGINAYDFINMLTWIGSHPKDFKVNEELALKLKINAGDMFIGRTYNDYAPNVDIEYPRFSIME